MTLTRAEIKRRYRERHPGREHALRKLRTPNITCVECGALAVHEGHGKCRKCYKREYAQRPEQKARNNARSAAWNEAHRQETRDYFVNRMASDPIWAAKRRAHYRRMVARDRAAEVAKATAWAKANPEKRQAQYNLRRARKLAVPSTLTSAEWQAILDYFGGRCAYCLKPGSMTMDHMVPLVRGGHHVADNIVPACRRCNSSKRAATPLEYLMRAA